MIQIFCPECKKILFKIKDDGAAMGVEAKCDRCNKIIEVNYCTASSFYHLTNDLNKTKIKVENI